MRSWDLWSTLMASRAWLFRERVKREKPFLPQGDEGTFTLLDRSKAESQASLIGVQRLEREAAPSKLDCLIKGL